ncbi:hypothetical protein DPMN_004313 [Dreissena polymorpha]|uniref:PLAT domain-containing protein n=1 Tax=Dreissena polymorpha TaxID=45954 RepID=A0A9D4MR23_DREPO|nr:hypothetical protein DPMN_004313 [Dreissena polymorpha]
MAFLACPAKMYGPDGTSEEISLGNNALENNADYFDEGMCDKFTIEVQGIGRIRKVRIGHDDEGTMSGWFLEKLLIQRRPRDGTKTEDNFFFVNRWFARSEDDGKIVRELFPTDEFGRPLKGL